MILSIKSLLRPVLKMLVKIPCIIEGYIFLSNKLNQIPVIDSSWNHLEIWLDSLDKLRLDEDSTGMPDQRMLFYSVLPTHVDYSLLLALALLERDVVIDFAWSAYPTYSTDQVPIISFPWWIRSMKNVVPFFFHPRLKLIDLDMISPHSPTKRMKKLAEKQARMDTSYVLRKERTNIDSSEYDRNAYEFRYVRNLEAITKIARLIKENHYDRIVMLNGGILEFGAVFSFITEQKVPISTMEGWGEKEVVVSSGANVMTMDISEYWQRDEPHILTSDRKARVQRVIDSRQRMRSEGVSVFRYQSADVAPAEQIRRELNLIPNLPVVLICPNVPYDAAYYVEGKRCFSTMWEWLVNTIEYFVRRDDCQIIIRSHPAEPYYKAKETTLSLIAEHFPCLPKNIQVVAPDADINTYSIMDIADLGIVYWSTTGMEMALRGIPVVCGVPALYYNGKGFTLDPSTSQEYFSMISNIIHNPSLFRLNPRQIELAWCFVDVWFNQWIKPFPWQQGNLLWKNLMEWPLERMWATEGKEQFGPVFDILLGD